MDENPQTFGNHYSPASLCRQRGWKVGTVLGNPQYPGASRMAIVAICREKVVAIYEREGKEYLLTSLEDHLEACGEMDVFQDELSWMARP